MAEFHNRTPVTALAAGLVAFAVVAMVVDRRSMLNPDRERSGGFGAGLDSAAPVQRMIALPLEFLLAHGWLPWERHEDSWVFASCSPFDLEVNAWLAEHASRPALRLLSSDNFEALRTRLGLDKSDLQLDGLSL